MCTLKMAQCQNVVIIGIFGLVLTSCYCNRITGQIVFIFSMVFCTMGLAVHNVKFGFVTKYGNYGHLSRTLTSIYHNIP